MKSETVKVLKQIATDPMQPTQLRQLAVAKVQHIEDTDRIAALERELSEVRADLAAVRERLESTESYEAAEAIFNARATAAGDKGAL